MRAVLPGKPRATLGGLCTGHWDNKRLIVRCKHPARILLLKDLHLGLHQWERFRCPCWTRFDHPDHL
jgi:hypothetical protein